MEEERGERDDRDVARDARDALERRDSDPGELAHEDAEELGG